MTPKTETLLVTVECTIEYSNADARELAIAEINPQQECSTKCSRGYYGIEVGRVVSVAAPSAGQAKPGDQNWQLREGDQFAAGKERP